MSDPLRASPDPRLQRQRPTDQELDREAVITPEDVAAAVAAFNRYAPPEARGLLNAVVEEQK